MKKNNVNLLILAMACLIFAPSGFSASINMLTTNTGFEDGLNGWNVNGFQSSQVFIDRSGNRHLPSSGNGMTSISNQYGYLEQGFNSSRELASISFDMNLIDPGFYPGAELDAFVVWAGFYDRNGSLSEMVLIDPNLTNSNTWETVTYVFPEFTYRPENNINNKLGSGKYTFRLSVEPNATVSIFNTSEFYRGTGTVLFDNISLNTVPVPAAVWLFGTGLISLVGFARHRKT